MGSKTWFNPVLANNEQVVHFLLCGYKRFDLSTKVLVDNTLFSLMFMSLKINLIINACLDVKVIVIQRNILINRWPFRYSEHRVNVLNNKKIS